MKLLITHYC